MAMIDTQAFIDAMNNPTVKGAMEKLMESAPAEVQMELAEDTQIELPLDTTPRQVRDLPDFSKLAELVVAQVIATGQTTYSHNLVKRVLENMWMGKSAFSTEGF